LYSLSHHKIFCANKNLSKNIDAILAIALPSRHSLESKALALGVFYSSKLFSVTVVLVPKAEALDSRIKLIFSDLFLTI
jgi:hypothetical protein